MKGNNASQAVLAVLINNLVEQIFCVADIVNPHSVSTPSSFKQRQIHLLYDPRGFWQYLSSSEKSLKIFGLNGHWNTDLCDVGGVPYQLSWPTRPAGSWSLCGTIVDNGFNPQFIYMNFMYLSHLYNIIHLFSSRNSSARTRVLTLKFLVPAFICSSSILTPAITILRFVLHLVWCFSQPGKDALGTCTIITLFGVVINITD